LLLNLSLWGLCLLSLLIRFVFTSATHDNYF